MEMSELQKLEMEAYELNRKILQLRKESPLVEVKNYSFQTLQGEVTLKELFNDKETLLLIHNMGEGCRYCTLWADGINPFLPHLEESFAVAMVSKDSPQAQRKMANDRGWRFTTASHGGGEYIQEQNVMDSNNNTAGNYPGIVCYQLKDGKIYRKNRNAFGPGDEFCTFWNLINLAGEDESSWTPQFTYWKRPEKMDDGGQNLN